MKTEIKVYRNKRNENKYIEVHYDGYHRTLRQYMQWKTEKGIVKNILGDGKLHRWSAKDFKSLIEDYEECNDVYFSKYYPDKNSGSNKIAIVINDKKLVYEESRGRYRNKYIIHKNEANIQGDDLVGIVCPCGLVFGYEKYSSDHYDVYVD